MKPRLLLYLAPASDLQRFAVAPSLAALVAHAAGGWRFDCVFDMARDGRHFGAGDPEGFGLAAGNGPLLAGGGYGEQLLWMAARYEIAAVGDPMSTAWPVLDAAGAEALCRDADPAAIYEAVLGRLDVAHLPRRLLVVDGSPQGRNGIVVAPYLLPAAFVDGPAIAVDVSADAPTAKAVAALVPADGAHPPLALYVDPKRAEAFALDLGEREGTVGSATYAEVTAALARRHAAWGRGILLGDPHLVAAQAAKAARLRLLPVHGRPQVDVIDELDDLVRGASEPVYGRQWDDRDFFALARAGRGLQVVDPPPPFDSAAALAALAAPAAAGGAAVADEPTDSELEAWAADGRILTTLLFWVGMIREADCYPALVDLLAATRLRAGLIVTVDAITHAPPSALSLLGAPAGRGGVLGQAELLAGSTGFGVAAEAELPDGVLARTLTDARRQFADLLPPSLQPRGWWPLLDTTMQPHPVPRVGRRGWRPFVYLTPHRSVVNAIVHRTKAYRFTDERRPYDHVRPRELAPAVASAVKGAGFDHMWTKASFGAPRIAHTDGEFVALPFTAGNWDGWSPFYTVSSVADLTLAERNLTATSRPGWLVSTVDSPLWLLSGERQRHGSWLHAAAARIVAGGRSGRLVNTTPSVIARYARLLARRA